MTFNVPKNVILIHEKTGGGGGIRTLGGGKPILKVRLLHTTSFYIATYGSESWAMTKNDRKRVDAFEMWYYTRLLHVSWKDKKNKCVGSGQDWNRLDHQKGNHGKKNKVFGAHY